MDEFGVGIRYFGLLESLSTLSSDGQAFRKEVILIQFRYQLYIQLILMTAYDSRLQNSE
jgi:hypothetical protein